MRQLRPKVKIQGERGGEGAQYLVVFLRGLRKLQRAPAQTETEEKAKANRPIKMELISFSVISKSGPVNYEQTDENGPRSPNIFT